MVTNRVVGLVMDVVANTISKMPADLLAVRVNFTYVGPAQTIQVEAYITYDQVWDHFDKVGGARAAATINQPAATIVSSFFCNLTGINFSGVEPGKKYGILLRFYGDLEGTGIRNWVEWGNRACINLGGAPPPTYGTMNLTSLALS